MESAILDKYHALPDDLRREVVDFIEFLEIKHQKALVESTSLAHRRASLFGNAKGLITIMPGFEDTPEGFAEYC
ncbi:DUF2281 domain-containing protein [Spirosoma soli]|uniref:DUF2281 domain-containing protein n=1 Tax=Spirosoma soli TaxID=1770529 RepID=A0ABW5M4X6_9BACT